MTRIRREWITSIFLAVAMKAVGARHVTRSGSIIQIKNDFYRMLRRPSQPEFRRWNPFWHGVPRLKLLG
jgi:hypothetical protein